MQSKKIRLSIFSLVLIVGAMTLSSCTKKLETDQQKASYAIGQQIGKNLKGQNVDFDADIVAMALKDVQKDQNQLTQEGIQQALSKLQETAMKKQQEEAGSNLQKANQFLEENKTKPGITTTASGMQYQVLKEGSGKTPSDDDEVKVHYTGTLLNGTKFDSSVDRNQPAQFPVRGVIPGWTEALKLMKPGAKFKLFIPPGLAYGPSGRPGIPANSALIFDVELLEILGKPAKKK